MKIFLGDLVHDWEKVSVWTVPLNIGLIASYAKKRFGGDIDIRLFKHPEEIIAAIRNEGPDVVALSYYAWNSNLDNLITEIAKKTNHNILTVGGGPSFTLNNTNEINARQFFSKHLDLDVYVLNQGEKGFAELLARFMETGGDRAQLVSQEIPGSLVNDLRKGGKVRLEKCMGLAPLDSLDEIPSPYLLGMMDPYLDNAFVPLLETNRNCPYQCTFCAFGVSSGKLKTFSLDRVLREIEYISQKTKADYLIITDTNFGILERDEEIADSIYANHLRYGFPGHLCVVWNKSRPDRVLKTARKFRGLAQVGASMQSLHPEVLRAIKRKNLPLQSVANMHKELQGINTNLFSELIAGLPNQTLESHLEDNRKLMSFNAEIFNFVLRFLPGTEIDSHESRSKYYNNRSAWRLQDNAFGIYDDVQIFEGEELAVDTTTMSFAEVLSLRLIHFLLQVMWGKKIFIDFLHFFKGLGEDPVDVILAIAEELRGSQGVMGKIHRRFEQDRDLEKFATYEDMCQYWSRPEAMQRLRSGNYGKLNILYTLEILLHYDEFMSFIQLVSHRILKNMSCHDLEKRVQQCNEILRFTRMRYVQIGQDRDFIKLKLAFFSFDIVKWRENGYDMTLLEKNQDGLCMCEFYLSDHKIQNLEKNLKLSSSANLDVTLRKILDIDANLLFYQVRSAVSPDKHGT